MKESKISVLIADDNKEFCNILNDYLLSQRDIVVTGIAKDGLEALKLIKLVGEMKFSQDQHKL